ncbi:FAD-dependent oxidoreductase [Acidithiobacillus sp. CV18-2]|uniref:FAD-dependent oxidoreductase n=1 Tax=Igneacidithiobacillus copahuensis TaxID=2724909 RepID=A0AAE3CJA6_9PROT|nr:FAD-dependent oxidoreductase [Acidithiobacillus sp. CV18-3]MBU2757252.1 FAD-dependent oxidoreductase [Acidithiobacillus sp. BN09-2]MBU2776821.1 FAD-dependent oxidoreductase [Acidithiobacillus sp. CV18-2]MBU2787175.1 FAD-dependent oxidoreductase [Igneacidithiobacillus copahuensis]MBU2796431.1 FAD-dependent oxidoreductase [Acidithiobacillus sp. VAN18-2]MBU2799449.1 FAD-dependent oxidoreductase [Acidithiobacillus sp. VAN18-4]
MAGFGRRGKQGVPFLKLSDFAFSNYLQAETTQELDTAFLDALRERDTDLAQRLLDHRAGRAAQDGQERSELLLALAPHLENFLVEFFAIADANQALQAKIRDQDVVMDFKKQFVLRRGRRFRGEFAESFSDLQSWLDQQMHASGLPADDREWSIARLGMGWLADEAAHAEAIQRLTQWCALALSDPSAKLAVEGWSSFRLPERMDHENLVPLVHAERADHPLAADPQNWRRRDAFHLTDQRMDLRSVQSEVHYCLYCHDHDGDFCSRGFPEKKGVPELGFKVDPLGVTLTGCPLEEKISEMQILRRDGFSIAALAMIMVDNPMVPATGHRICNDCMKGCVYQKQDPVNIPQVETRILTDVLELPLGVEIYDLLTRWNPLRQEQFVATNDNGRKVLVAGMGPAGFTMAHHLLQAGCTVVGVDGLKIEPLPDGLQTAPVRDWSALQEDLDERILLGFGGVAEYGITVRWDKNFLKLIYLSLLRRPGFQIFGGVRLGGTLRLEDAWELGFDHVCLATGAGLPRVLSLPGSLARGMRQASDFLMALQLTGAGKKSSLANLQVRLPAVVIGGGLTAVDTATEVQAYYIRQVEKVLARYEALLPEMGEEKLRAGLSEEDAGILDEFLAHGRAVRAERERAAAKGEEPNFIPLLHAWGGVTLAYRKGMRQSPAYTRNHEELIKAMEEGLFYQEGADPLRADLDGFGHVEAMVFRKLREEDGRWVATGEELCLPARSVFVAAGTVPNTIYEREYPGTLQLDGDHFQPHLAHPDRSVQEVQVAEHCKSPEPGPFTSYQDGVGHRVSFIGDTHPVYHGSVVKAIASAKRSYPDVLAAMEILPPAPRKDLSAFQERLKSRLSARIRRIDRSNPAVCELWVEAPAAASNFQPGQFFRLQSFETGSPVVEDTRLQIPVLTVSGAGVEGDLIRLMVLQWGTAPRIAGRLQEGDPVLLMGPTGAPTDIPQGKTIAVVAGRWGAAVMLDIGPALRAAGNRVLYVAAFAQASELDHQDELEAAADQILWCTARGPKITARRSQDLSVEAADMVQLLREYAAGQLPGQAGDGIPLQQVDRLMVMGSTGLLKGFQSALRGDLGSLFPAHLEAVATVGSPMQCMLKGVCAQCLQWQVDPETGKRTQAVFTCAGQDQPLAWVDLDNLTARQGQNRLLERLSSHWLDHVLARADA